MGGLYCSIFGKCFKEQKVYINCILKKGLSGIKNVKGNLGILIGKKKCFNNFYYLLIEIEDSICIFLMK